ncbi:MAG TPA: Crp/Fnr family transcriptional regulator [Gaiellaceae bacterium]
MEADLPLGDSALESAKLARLLALCPRLVLRAGDVRGASDFPDAKLLLVEKGTVVVASGASAKRRIAFGFCSQGMLLLPPRLDEQLAAVADSAVLSVTRAVELRLLQLPRAAEAIVDLLLEALREQQESLAQFANVEHVERVRGKLLQLARRHGVVVADGIRVELPLTHALLAQAVGSARETVTSALRTLERDGFLVREGRRYRLMISPEIFPAGGCCFASGNSWRKGIRPSA